MNVGNALPEFSFGPIPQSALSAWSDLLGDPNPIHLDPAAVRAKGLGDRTINQGPANLAYLFNMLAFAFPGAEVTSITTRFTGNVYSGDIVRAGGEVTMSNGDEHQCDVWLVAAEGKPVVTGTATVRSRSSS